MVGEDVEFVRKCLNSGIVRSPCLELGVGYQGPNNREMVRAANIEYFGTDISAGKDVDYIVDFEDSAETIAERFAGKRFGSVVVLNVLEHTFDPIRVLDNVFSILETRGTCIIVTPTIWPLHDFPQDCWRINPNFYEEYCKRRSLNLLREYFEYVGFHGVQERVDASGSYVLPSPDGSALGRMKSKVIHRIFDTCGRGMFFPSHVATGVVIEKPV
jgi:SAM-dependent methyltransferase